MKTKSFEVKVKTTCNCNLNCPYCYDSCNKDRLGDMKLPLDKVDKLYKMLSDYSEEVKIIYHGGEPTLIGQEWYKDACELSYEYYDSVFEFNIQTNGVTSVYNPSWLSVFENYNSIVGFSFDVSSQQLRTGHIGDYSNNLISTINNLASTDVDTGIISVISNENVADIIKNYETVKEKFRNRLSCVTFSLCTESRLNHHPYAIVPSRDFEYLRDFRKHLLMDREGFIETFTMQYIRGLLIPESVSLCYTRNCNRTTMGIHPDGEFLYCDSLFHENRLPNINEVGSVQDIFNSEAYKGIEEDMQFRLKSKCEKCSYYSMCDGYCITMHYNYTGDLRQCSEQVCGIVKMQYNSTYDALQSIAIGTLLNRKIETILLNYYTFLPMEVEYFLNKLGLDVKMHLNIDYNTELPDTWQFKLFNIFVSSERVDNEYFFSDGRFELFKPIYEKNKDKIMNILGGNNG